MYGRVNLSKGVFRIDDSSALYVDLYNDKRSRVRILFAYPGKAEFIIPPITTTTQTTFLPLFLIFAQEIFALGAMRFNKNRWK
jgi:hypothetical protein